MFTGGSCGPRRPAPSGALLAVHLHKENDLVLPLLAADPGVELATILGGMHQLIGTRSGV